MQFRLSLFAIGLAVFIGTAAPAQAGSTSAALEVSLTVTDACSVAAAPLAFGTVAKDASQAGIESSAALTLACTPNTAFTVALDNGAHAAAGSRRMKGAALGDYVDYEIYTSSARTARWGQDAGIDTVSGTAPDGTASLTAHGRIGPATAPLRADSYSDTVTVTVSF